MKLIRLEDFIKQSEEEIIRRVKESSLMDGDLIKLIYFVSTVDEQSICLWKALDIAVPPISLKRKINKKAKPSNLRFGIFWDRMNNTFDLSVYRQKMSGQIPLITIHLRGEETYLEKHTWSPSEN